MGCKKNITHNTFPKQSELVGSAVDICFHYNTKESIKGSIIRDDIEEPFETLIITIINDKLVYLRSAECHFSITQETL